MERLKTGKSTSAPPRRAGTAAAVGFGRGGIALLLAIAVVAALWPVCSAEFTSWDDAEAIAANPTMLPPTWHSLADWWSKPTADLWIPVTYTAWGGLALVAQMPGPGGPSPNPWVFHSANLILHLLAALVVFRLLEFLIRQKWAAAAGAALFALHPVQVEPVAWAAGMKDVLCGLLALLAIWQYLLASAGPRGRRRNWHFAAATAAYALALLAKPTAVIVPILAGVLEIAARRFSRRVLSAEFSGRRRETRKNVEKRDAAKPGAAGAARRLHWASASRLGLWLAMAVPIVVVAHRVQPIHRASEYVPMLWRPMVALDALAFYVGKILWPAHLGLDYGRTPWKIVATGQWLWTWVVPASIAGVLLLFARRRPMAWAGAAVFVAGLLPELGLVGFDFQGISTVADHYLYLPMLGGALLFALLLATPAVVRHKRIAVAAVLAVLALLAGRSFAQTWSWHDSQTLFQHALAINNASGPANESLCGICVLAGDADSAIRYARASTEGNPRRPNGWPELAKAYTLAASEAEAAGDRRGSARFNLLAMSAMEQAYRLDPEESRVLVDLGVKLVAVNRVAEAEQRFRQALQRDPTSAYAQANLAVLLAQTGRREEGFSHAQRAAELDPDNANAQTILGDFLREMGRPAEATRAYERALSLKHGFAPALVGLDQTRGNAATRPVLP